ncbi:hypothetical protein [Frondihabitans sp. VKM Ac-2883]|uniref:hypothetical protein n=1 Tax=Frondihabitans sp. VKM Ac-2883 TaxID=2783823 RepID=UPI00188BE6E0|nr:hypothetical protein [Frondihabitans sp. VKM Ac-2883]MBF4574661.1 hypothetical protein [Frondihabitans sp. VKM Ac-2883]
MGVSGPFKGSRAEWFAANGWRHVLHAQASRWDLREYPDQVPARWTITRSNELMKSEARIFPSSSGGWVLDPDADFRGAPVDRFPDPGAAFAWWVAQQP